MECAHQRAFPVLHSAQETPRDERIEGAGDLGLGAAVRDPRCPRGHGHQVRVGYVPKDEGQRQDAHERAVALGHDRAGLLGRDPVAQPRQGRRRRVADVEDLAGWRVGTLLAPVERPSGLVSRVESDREERIEERQHEGAVIAPGARRLVVGAVTAPRHLADAFGRLELVGDSEGIADEVPVDGATEPFRQPHVLVPASRSQRLAHGRAPRRPAHPRHEGAQLRRALLSAHGRAARRWATATAAWGPGPGAGRQSRRSGGTRPTSCRTKGGSSRGP